MGKLGAYYCRRAIETKRYRSPSVRGWKSCTTLGRVLIARHHGNQNATVAGRKSRSVSSTRDSRFSRLSTGTLYYGRRENTGKLLSAFSVYFSLYLFCVCVCVCIVHSLIVYNMYSYKMYMCWGKRKTPEKLRLRPADGFRDNTSLPPPSHHPPLRK